MQPSLSSASAIWRDRFARVVEIMTAASGIATLVAAVAATQPWLDRHFLPSFFIPRHWYLLIETIVRVAIGAGGAWLALARVRVARLVTADPGTTLAVLVAAILAVAASELALRWIHLQPTEWLAREEEPRRLEDAELGWILAPGRVGRSVVGGRALEYAIDAGGSRVRRLDEPVDRQRPTMVFVGESVMFGEGLDWDESIPAQTSAKLHVQAANLSVHGYSTDQIYLRLARELPRFSQPVAVVSIFMTELFGRNLDDDRPHLGAGLDWTPAQRSSRLATLAGLLVPYRRDATVEHGIVVTHAVFRAMVELTRRRGATPLVVVPQFGQDDDVERRLRARILGDDVPSEVVHLDPDWRLAWDRHPNARAAHAIAAAIAARLHSGATGMQSSHSNTPVFGS